ncbi:MAG: InlB B-repeat-containing protein, partial [Atopobiaceae bacterium]|nr:InlB B-repeat-containing protein [Atopobiaceae bacterium]
TADGDNPSDVPTDPGEGTTEDPTDDPNPSLSSEKSSTGNMTGLDANGKPAYAEGDTLTYTITVTNDGNLTASGITVVDEKLGYTEDAPFAYEGEIAPGETVTVLEAEYTVTAEDVEAGSVFNEATVTGTTEGGDPDPVNPTDEQPVEKIYTITYVPNGGTFADGSTANVIVHAKYNEVITIIDAPTREGYVFTYWKGSEYQPGDSYTVTEDHTFTAQWETEAQPEPKPADVLPKTSDPTAYTAMAYAAATGLSAIATGLRLRRRRRKEDEA